MVSNREESPESFIDLTILRNGSSATLGPISFLHESPPSARSQQRSRSQERRVQSTGTDDTAAAAAAGNKREVAVVLPAFEAEDAAAVKTRWRGPIRKVMARRRNTVAAVPDEDTSPAWSPLQTDSPSHAVSKRQSVPVLGTRFRLAPRPTNSQPISETWGGGELSSPRLTSRQPISETWAGGELSSEEASPKQLPQVHRRKGKNKTCPNFSFNSPIVSPVATDADASFGFGNLDTSVSTYREVSHAASANVPSLSLDLLDQRAATLAVRPRSSTEDAGEHVSELIGSFSCPRFRQPAASFESHEPNGSFSFPHVQQPSASLEVGFDGDCEANRVMGKDFAKQVSVDLRWVRGSADVGGETSNSSTLASVTLSLPLRKSLLETDVDDGGVLDSQRQIDLQPRRPDAAEMSPRITSFAGTSFSAATGTFTGSFSNASGAWWEDDAPPPGSSPSRFNCDWFAIGSFASPRRRVPAEPSGNVEEHAVSFSMASDLFFLDGPHGESWRRSRSTAGFVPMSSATEASAFSDAEPPSFQHRRRWSAKLCSSLQRWLPSRRGRRKREDASKHLLEGGELDETTV